MAYYYFFITSEQLRKGDMKPTLRALPNQTFPDGTPVDTELNVMAPKAKGKSPYGNRLDYPYGTVFCSDHLELTSKVNASGTQSEPYYTVYDKTNVEGSGNYPNFHPVSTDKNFAYVALTHQNQDMNKQYLLFMSGLGQGTIDNETETDMESNENIRPARLSPVDENGHARAFETNWTERYTGQIETERNFIRKWISNYMTTKGLSGRILVDVYKDKLLNLYQAGETVDSIANAERLENIINAKGQTLSNISILPGGIFGFYIDALHAEHQKGSKCTAVARNHANIVSVKEAANIISDNMNDLYGGTSQPDNPTALANLKKALEIGWTVDDLMDSSINSQAKSYPELVKALADGTIPFNKGEILVGGVSKLDMLLTDPRNAKPSDKDGFHIEDKTWKQLLFALYNNEPTLLVGPSGTGKTEIITRLCEKTGTPYTIIQMGGVTEPYEQLVLGKDLANNGTETVDNWAEFALAIQRPGVIILDEINRIPRHGSNTLFNCLDGARTLDAPTAKDPAMKKIKVHPDCVFFATANIGVEYTDASQIDEALRTRFGVLGVGYLEQKDEETVLRTRTGIKASDAKNIAFIANNIRDKAKKNTISHSISTRETLRIARMVKFGFTCQEALELSLLPNYDDGFSTEGVSERDTIRNLISNHFSRNTTNNKA